MNYEIRNINGQDVFVKNISDDFWLINDVYVLVCDGYELTDIHVLSLLSAKNRPVFPYCGAEKGCVLVVSKLNDGSFVEEQAFLSELTDETISPLARRAYDEYKSWAGI